MTTDYRIYSCYCWCCCWLSIAGTTNFVRMMCTIMALIIYISGEDHLLLSIIFLFIRGWTVELITLVQLAIWSGESSSTSKARFRLSAELISYDHIEFGSHTILWIGKFLVFRLFLLYFCFLFLFCVRTSFSQRIHYYYYTTRLTVTRTLSIYTFPNILRYF